MGIIATNVYSLAVVKDGENGNDGKGIKSTSISYQTSSSGTTVPTGTWQTSVPSVSAGQYLWTKLAITYTDNTTTNSYSVSRNGTNGTNGSDGKGIKSTAITYQASTSGTTVPTGTWNSTIPSVAENEYLWTRTIITYTDNSTSTSYSIGKMGKNGIDGTNGVGVAQVDVFYYLSTSSSSLSGGSWSTTAPEWENGKYMWSKTVVTYTDHSSTTSEPVCITGANGVDGKGIKSIIEYYYQSSSATSLSGGSWSTTYPGWVNGKYIWTKSITTYTDNSTSETTPICVTGAKGSNGTNGTSSYMFTRYSSTESPHSDMYEVPVDETLYIGTYISSTNKASTDPSDYDWVRYRSEDPLSVKINADNGTAFCNDGKSISLTAVGKKGEKSISGTYKWYKDGTVISGATSATYSVACTGLNVYTIFKCELTYDGETVSDSITIQNNVSVLYGDTNPYSGDSTIYTGSIWINTSTDPNTYYRYDGSKWVQIIQQQYYNYVGYGQGKTTEFFTTKIKETADDITMVANRVTVTETTIDENYSELKQTADNIQSQVTSVKTDFDNMEVGGRNLLKYTAYENLNGVNNRGNYHTVSIDSENKYNGRNSLKIICNTVSVSGSQDVSQKLWSNLTVNDNLVFSFWIKGSTSTKMWCRVAGGSASNNISQSSDSKAINVTTNWQKITYDFGKCTGSGTEGSVEIIYGFGNTGTYWINSMKLEIGTKPTDWSPAPEDVESSIEAVQTVATQTADKFNWLVKSGTSATDFTLTDRTATLIAENINLNGLVTFSGLSSGAQSTIQGYSIDALNSAKSYTDDEIDEIGIIGRNIQRYSDFSDSSKWSLTNGAIIENGVAIFTACSKQVEVWRWENVEPIPEGKAITVSGYILENTLSGGDGLRLYIGVIYSGDTDPSWFYKSVDSEYTGKISYTFIIPNGKEVSQVCMDFDAYNCTSGQAKIKNYKIEIGDKATDWTPALEDINESIYTLGTWCYNNDRTYINGGKIYTGSVTADKISVNTLEAICAKIGGFNISSNAIYNGTPSLSSTTAGIYLGKDGIRNYKDANTYVDIKNGVLTANGANISGTITTMNTVTSSSGYDIDWVTKITGGRIILYNGESPVGRVSPIAWGNDYDNCRGLMLSTDSTYLSLGHNNGNNLYSANYVLNNGLNPDGITEPNIFYGNTRFKNKVYINGSLEVPTISSTTINSTDITSNSLSSHTINSTDISTTNISSNISESNYIITDSIRSNSSNEIIKFDNTYIHKASGTSGSAGYVKVAQMVIGGNYQNAPIKLHIIQRDVAETILQIRFANANNTDPALQSFVYQGGKPAYLVKSATSTWNLYVQKSEGYDNICISQFYKPHYDSSITIIWIDEQVSSLPSGYVTSSLYSPNDTGWIAVSSFSNSFANSSGSDWMIACAYRKIGNHVYVRGDVKTPTSWEGSGSGTIFTLPSGYTPAKRQYYFNPMTGTRIARLFIDTDGRVVLEWTKNISDASAATGELAWVRINTDFLAN